MIKKLLKITLFAFIIFISMYSAVALTQTSSESRTLNFINEFLSNGTTTNMIDDYSGGEVFEIQPPSNETWIISRAIVYIKDDKNWNGDRYGNDVVLTNGIIVRVNQTGTLINLTSDPINVTADWAAYCYDVNYFTSLSGSDQASVRWTFSKSGTFIKLNGSNEDSLQVALSDDFSGLIEHTILLQGYKFEEVNETDNMGSLSITLFVLISALLFIVAPMFLRFKTLTITNIIIRRGLFIIGIYLMVLNSAMMATIASAAGLALTNELFRYMWLFGWVGYIIIFATGLTTIFEIMKLFRANALDKRMGGDGD